MLGWLMRCLPQKVMQRPLATGVPLNFSFDYTTTVLAVTLRFASVPHQAVYYHIAAKQSDYGHETR